MVTKNEHGLLNALTPYTPYFSLTMKLYIAKADDVVHLGLVMSEVQAAGWRRPWAYLAMP